MLDSPAGEAEATFAWCSVMWPKAWRMSLVWLNLPKGSRSRTHLTKEAQALAVVRWIVHVPIPDEEDAGAVTENVPVCIGAGQKVLLALGGLVENCFSLVWSEWKILCCKDPPAPPGAFSQPAEQKNMRLLC